MKIKILISTVLILLSLNEIKAQYPAASNRGFNANNIYGSIQGSIIEHESKKPIPYATIKVLDSKKVVISGAISNEKGFYAIDKIKIGTYFLELSAIGYETLSKEISIQKNQPNINLKKIALKQNAKLLDQIKVESQASLIENKIDKIVFNVDKDPTLVGGTAEDALNKVPYVSVDQDGNLSIRGNSNINIMVDGRLSTLLSDNPADALKAISSDQIKSIEVITNPSAKFDASGSGGIVNIVTKKNKLEGKRFGLSGYGGNRRARGNLNIASKKNKLGLNLSIGSGLNLPSDAISTYEVKTNNQLDYSRTGALLSQRVAGRGALNIDYDFNKTNKLMVSSQFFSVRYSNQGSSDIFSSPGFSFIENALFQETKRLINNFETSVNYINISNDQSRELVFGVQHNNGNSNNTYSNIYASDNDDIVGKTLAQNNEITFQSDWSKKFNKATKLELGLKYILRNADNILDETRYEALKNNVGVNDIDNFNQTITTTFNLFKYKQNVGSFYASAKIPISRKFSILAGGRIELTSVDGIPENNSLSDLSFKINYTNFFPNIAVSYKLDKISQLKFFFSKRISRPSIRHINPFVNLSNPDNASQGNPQLDPEITSNFEIAFSTFYKNFLNLNLAVFYRLEDNLIENYFFISDLLSDPQRKLTYENVGINKALGMNVFTSINLNKVVNLSVNFNLNNYNISPFPAFTDLNTDISKWVYSGSVRASYIYKKYSVEVFGRVRSLRRTLQGTRASFNIWVVSFKRKFLADKATLGLTFIDPHKANKSFPTVVQSGDRDIERNFTLPFRSIAINFSYNIGKLKRARSFSKIKNDDQKQGGDAEGQN